MGNQDIRISKDGLTLEVRRSVPLGPLGPEFQSFLKEVRGRFHQTLPDGTSTVHVSGGSIRDLTVAGDDLVWWARSPIINDWMKCDPFPIPDHKYPNVEAHTQIQYGDLVGRVCLTWREGGTNWDDPFYAGDHCAYWQVLREGTVIHEGWVDKNYSEALSESRTRVMEILLNQWLKDQ